MLISTKAGGSHFMAACPFANLGNFASVVGRVKRGIASAMRTRTNACLAAGLAAALTTTTGFARRAAAGAELYVSAEESGEIVVVDADRGEVAARVPVGKRPRGVKLSRDGKLLYVALSG